jgi:hypothetical protein
MGNARLGRTAAAVAVAASAILGSRLAAADVEPAAGCNAEWTVAGYYCFYPYATSYIAIDPGYAFGADPVTGLVYRPRVEAVPERVHRAAPPLMKPRASYADALANSGDDL